MIFIRFNVVYVGIGNVEVVFVFIVLYLIREMKLSSYIIK